MWSEAPDFAFLANSQVMIMLFSGVYPLRGTTEDYLNTWLNKRTNKNLIISTLIAPSILRLQSSCYYNRVITD